jgi:hypothetical protein
LHGEPVALSDPSDQDIVRSRLCRTQWPSRKVGRIGLAAGSMGTARFLKLSQVRDFTCDLPHSRGDKRKIGIIIRKYFLHAPVATATAIMPTLSRLCRQSSPWFPSPHQPVFSGLGRSPAGTRFPLISLAKQGQAAPLRPDSARKIPNLKAFQLRFSEH